MRKLIRDNLAEVISAKDLKKSTDDDDFINLLLAKLDEELEELAFSDYKDVEEYADVFEVLFAIAKFHGMSREDVINTRIKKFDKRGGFDKRLILDRKD